MPIERDVRDFETMEAWLLALLLDAIREGLEDRAEQRARELAHWTWRLAQCQPCPDCQGATIPSDELGSDFCEVCGASWGNEKSYGRIVKAEADEEKAAGWKEVSRNVWMSARGDWMKASITVPTDWHVTPRDDLREHEHIRGCWCQPRLEGEDRAQPCLVIHNSADGRELVEEHGIN